MKYPAPEPARSKFNQYNEAVPPQLKSFHRSRLTSRSRCVGMFLLIVCTRAAAVQPIMISTQTFVTYNVLPNAVSYDGANYHQVLNDNGSGGYTAPQWKDNSSPPNGTATDPGDFRYPLSYTGGTSVSLSATLVANPSIPSGTNIQLQAVGPGFNMPMQSASIGPGQLLYPESQATTALSVGTSMMNSMVLNWQASTDGGKTWKNVGQTGNRLYVTLADPIASANLYQTVLFLATSNGTATKSANAIANTWAMFAGPANVKTWDGRPLYYYKPGQGFNACALNSGQLLSSPTGSGQCGSFAFLLIDAFGANGASSSFVQIAPTVDPKFLVNSWTFSQTPTYSTATPTYPWQMILSEGGQGMVPPFPNNVYGDLTSLSTLPGQNTSPPSEKVFNLHFIVQQGSNYYDPSYGVTYANPADFQNKAVAGYATQFSGDSTNQWHVRKSTISTDVDFSILHTYQ